MRGGKFLVGRLSVGIIALGIAHFGDLDGLLDHVGNRLSCGLGRFLRHRRFLGNRFLKHRLLDGLGDLLDLLFLQFQHLVVKLPGEVCVGGNNALVLIGNRGDMIGIQLKGSGGLFLSDIFLDQLALHKALGGFKGIELPVIHFLNVDGRKSLLLAGALNQLHCPFELSGGAKLVQEGGVSIFLLGAHVSAAVNGSLQGIGIQRKIELQNIGLDVDLGDLGSAVVEAVGAPADAALGSLVGKERVFQLTVILLDTGTRLNQLCLKALAVMGNDIASRVLVKADDTLVTGESVLAVGLFVVDIILVLGFGIVDIVKLVLILILVLVGILILDFHILREGSDRSVIGRGRLGFVILLTLLQLVIQKIGKLFHKLLGSLGLGSSRGNLPYHLFLRLGHDLLYDLVGTGAICKGGTLGNGSLGRGYGLSILGENLSLHLFHGSFLVKLLIDLLIIGLILKYREGILGRGSFLGLGIGILALLLTLVGKRCGRALLGGRNRRVFCLNQRRGILGRNEGISFFVEHDERHDKHHRGNRHQTREHRKRYVGGLRNDAKHEHSASVIIMPRGAALLCLDLLFFTVGT